MDSILNNARRLVILALVTVVIVFSVRSTNLGRERASAVSPASSHWFCVGGTTGDDSAADSSVILTNTLNSSVSGTGTVTSSDKTTKQFEVALRPFETKKIRLSNYAPVAFAASSFEFDDVGVVAELVVRGERGIDTTPCETRLRSNWIFADGSTELEGKVGENNKTFLSIYNPSSDDVSASISISALQAETEPKNSDSLATSSVREPEDWQNMLVKAKSLKTIDVSTQVRRRVAIALSVTARPGRIVVGELIERNGEFRKGISVSMGSHPSQYWKVPYANASGKIIERMKIYNPDPNDEATVTFRAVFKLKKGTATIPEFQRTVPAQQVDLMNSANYPNIPKTPHSWLIESDVPIVIWDTQDSGTDVAGGSAVSYRSKSWVVPFGTPTQLDRVIVFNPGTKNTSMKVTWLKENEAVEIEDLNEDLGPGERRVIDLKSISSTSPVTLRVDANHDVFVSREIVSTKGPGYAISSAIPVPSN